MKLEINARFYEPLGFTQPYIFVCLRKSEYIPVRKQRGACHAGSGGRSAGRRGACAARRHVHAPAGPPGGWPPSCGAAAAPSRSCSPPAHLSCSGVNENGEKIINLVLDLDWCYGYSKVRINEYKCIQDSNLPFCDVK